MGEARSGPAVQSVCSPVKNVTLIEATCQYESAELVVKDCPQTPFNAKMSHTAGGLGSTAVLKLSKVYMSVHNLVKRVPTAREGVEVDGRVEMGT